MKTKYPIWADRDPNTLLREIAPNLYIGAFASVHSMPWVMVIDLCGTSAGALSSGAYLTIPILLRARFEDGEPVPHAILDAARALLPDARKAGPVLIHCRAGLSRSASVGYAMLRILEEMRHDRALERVKVTRGYPIERTLHSARAWAYENTGPKKKWRDKDFQR